MFMGFIYNAALLGASFLEQFCGTLLWRILISQKDIYSYVLLERNEIPL